jgi:CheY-like chemotaxis protein
LKQILLIEDNVGKVILIQQIIAEKTPSVLVVAALDGEQAIPILTDPQFKPDLIILDLNIREFRAWSY